MNTLQKIIILNKTIRFDEEIYRSDFATNEYAEKIIKDIQFIQRNLHDIFYNNIRREKNTSNYKKIFLKTMKKFYRFIKYSIKVFISENIDSTMIQLLKDADYENKELFNNINSSLSELSTEMVSISSEEYINANEYTVLLESLE